MVGCMVVNDLQYSMSLAHASIGRDDFYVGRI